MIYQVKGNKSVSEQKFWANDEDDAKDQAEAWLGYPLDIEFDGFELISVEPSPLQPEEIYTP
jgi:hypothetical protein